MSRGRKFFMNFRLSFWWGKVAAAEEFKPDPDPSSKGKIKEEFGRILTRNFGSGSCSNLRNVV